MYNLIIFFLAIISGALLYIGWTLEGIRILLKNEDK